MKKLLAFFIMSFVAVCNAKPHNVYNETFFGPYASINEAATYALQKSYQMSNHFEFGGVIYEDKYGQFYFNLPRTDLGIDHVWMDHEAVFPNHPDFKMVGDYHTHPCYPYTHYPESFSSNDIFIYQAFGIQGYMGNFCNGNVMHWDPHNPDMLLELDGDGPFGLDHDSVYDGDITGHLSLNKKPDIQESIFDAIQRMNH